MGFFGTILADEGVQLIENRVKLLAQLPAQIYRAVVQDSQVYFEMAHIRRIILNYFCLALVLLTLT